MRAGRYAIGGPKSTGSDASVNTITSWGITADHVAPLQLPIFHIGGPNIFMVPLVHVGGTTNIVDQPEFRDREKLRGLIEVLEERKILTELVSTKGIKEGITITIGKEIERGEMQYCSLVTSPYKAGKVGGTIGIIGPTRMRYSKLVSMVEYAASLLGDALSK